MEEKKPSTVQHLVAGAAAGLIADICTHPVDTIRARLQVQRSNEAQMYKSTFHAFISTIKNEGWTALYKGFPIVAVGTVPAHALYFSGYEMVKNALEPNLPDHQKSAFTHFIAGNWAEVCGAVIWVPMDVIKQRLQVQKNSNLKENKYSGSFHAFQTILKEEGIRGLYKGYLAALLTYGPFVGTYFVAYEQSKRFYKKLLGVPTESSSEHQKSAVFPSSLIHLVSGFQSGAFAAAITCPMDVVKTRLQVESTLNTGERKYKNVVDAFVRIIREEGVSAFSKGLSARILWIAPGTAITIGAYEHLKYMLM